MGRSPCCAKEGLNRGAWTAIEDQILTDYINTHGEGNWRNLPKRAGLKRCGKSCRLRWLNYLRPDIKRGNISGDEEDLIIRLHKLLGNRWSLIAGRLPGRTDNEIKNYWNTNLSKKVQLHRYLPNGTGSPASSARRRSRKSRKLQQLHSLPTDDDDCPQVPESKAVRTKAVRCTRVFIDPAAAAAAEHPPKNIPDHPKSSHTGDVPPQPPEAATAATDFIVEHQTSSMMECRNVAGNGDLTPEYPNLAVDLGGMDEFKYLELYGLQGSEFSDIDNVEFGYEDTLSNSSGVSPEQPLVFSDEMFEDWTQTNAALHAAGGVDYWLPHMF
ncbi:hypothetical protein Dimus_026131 [Dionaea muscipula]